MWLTSTGVAVYRAGDAKLKTSFEFLDIFGEARFTVRLIDGIDKMSRVSTNGRVETGLITA